MKTLLTTLLFFTSLTVSASTVSETLMSEWQRFRQHISTLTPDGDVGGYTQYKEYDGMTLLWRLSDDPKDNEVIRFYIDRPGLKSFTVTYHKSDIIVDGRVVLRRFMGQQPTGWVNHTIDYHTLEYLGSQGVYQTPLAHELQMIRDWEIEILK